MTNTLYDSFHNYISVFQLLIEKRQENKTEKKGECLKLTLSEQKQLVFIVNETEGKKEFEEIVKATESEFPDYNEWGVGKHPIHNFFCNSGFYVNLFKGVKLNPDQLFDSYCKEFQKISYNIKLLAMMEFVDFTEESMDFDSFQIRKFSIKELSTILRNEINEIFYPRAYIDKNELNKLEKYYFIYLSAPYNAVRTNRKIYPSGALKPVPRNYIEYPEPLETILKYLILFEWEETPVGWMLGSHGFNFNIPVILQISESLLDLPTTIPDFPPLETTPVSSFEDVNEYIEIPAIRFDFNAKKTIQFKEFINKTKDILDGINMKRNSWKKDSWGFLDIAQRYLIKAFFTKGLEQLLWHIVVIDALFGENGGGNTKRMKNRISAILGCSKSEEFEELYKFRCSFVHGDKIDKDRPVYTDHLYNARQLARELLLWFLNYLITIQHDINKDQPNCGDYTRENLLKLIDIAEKEKYQKKISDLMPKGFPNVPKWEK